MMDISTDKAYEFNLLCLCIWREARGESLHAKVAVAWTIRNRVMNPGWWGKSWIGVILKPWQFSSFNSKDPNAVKWPAPMEAAWLDCVLAAVTAYSASESDPTNGATHYHDKSLDANPPAWAMDASMIHVINIGALRFYKQT